MELSFAFLAGSADYLADKRMVALGVDTDMVLCRVFPATATIALVMKWLFDPEEIDRPHSFKVEYIKPDGTGAKVLEQTPFSVAPNLEGPTFKAGASFIVNMSLLLESAGIYQFRAIVDDREIQPLALTVKLHNIPQNAIQPS